MPAAAAQPCRCWHTHTDSETTSEGGETTSKGSETPSKGSETPSKGIETPSRPVAGQRLRKQAPPFARLQLPLCECRRADGRTEAVRAILRAAACCCLVRLAAACRCLLVGGGCGGCGGCCLEIFLQCPIGCHMLQQKRAPSLSTPLHTPLIVCVPFVVVLLLRPLSFIIFHRLLPSSAVVLLSRRRRLQLGTVDSTGRLETREESFIRLKVADSAR